MSRLLFALTVVCLGGCTPSPAPRSEHRGLGAEAAAAPAETALAEPGHEQEPALRLDPSVAPTSVALKLAIDPKAPVFRGTMRADVEFQKPRRDFWMHAFGLEIQRASVRQGGELLSAETRVTPRGFLGLRLPRAVVGPVQLEIEYTGHIDAEHSQGIYRVDEPDGQAYVYTVFEPTDARKAFPCFDEPSFKVPWQVTLISPPGVRAFANTPEASESPAEGGWIQRVFLPTPPLPSYLVAFMVGPFDVKDSGTVGRAKRPLRFILPPGRRQELAYAESVTPAAVEKLESFFGLDYPFEKLDVAVVPRFRGTMEHPGIVAMGQPLTLIKPEEDSLDRRRAYTNILIHELGHYWFGDLVTMRWWDETWLNEGTTLWVDRMVTQDLMPSWNFDQKLFGTAHSAMRADALDQARPMRQPIQRHEDIEASFDGASTYNKGAALFGMLEHWLGKSAFRQALRTYLTEYAWQTTVTEDLVKVLNQSAGHSAGDVLKTFVDQVGVPALTFSLECAGAKNPTSKVLVQQQRYRPLGQSFSQDVAWKVPVCVRWPEPKGVQQRCEVLREQTAELDLGTSHCPKWLVPNAAGASYYHARLDTATRQSLGAARQSLSVGERYRYLDDLHLGLEAGDVPLDEMLRASQSFTRDAQAVVVLRALDAFKEVEEEWLSPTEKKQARQLFTKLARPLVATYGWQGPPNEGSEAFELRKRGVTWLLLAARDHQAVTRARREVSRWLDGGPAPSDELRWAFVQAATRGGDAALFEKVLNRAKRAERRDKSLLFSGLGNFTDASLAIRALELLLDSNLDARDSFDLLWTALREPENRERAYAFVVAHLPALLGRLNEEDRASLFGAAGFFCDVEHKNAATAALQGRVANVPGAELEWGRALAQVDLCIAKKARLLPALRRFLAKSGSTE